MGPIIILDKSALQSLSYEELVVLHRYYFVNITPVLIIEILGDLRKPSKKSMSEREVSQLARKLFPTDSVVNTHYKSAIEASILGFDVKMDRRPNVSGGRPVRTETGDRGYVFDEAPEEKALRRWREERFMEGEHVLAQRWRESTRGLDLDGFRRNLRNVLENMPKIDTFSGLGSFLDDRLSNPHIQTSVLMSLLTEFGIKYGIVKKVLSWWDSVESALVRDFAPYAYYCFYANLCFHIGLMNNLIGTRSTNRVDWEYVYYLPFCMVFASGDRFHKEVAPFFLRQDQEFVESHVLKLDLKAISEQCKLEEVQKHEWVPPDNPNSVTSQLWRKLARYPASDRKKLKRRPSKVKEKDLVEFIKKRADSPTDMGACYDFDEADFVIRRRTISVFDPYPCGSGKKYKDCHGEKGKK